MLQRKLILYIVTFIALARPLACAAGSLCLPLFEFPQEKIEEIHELTIWRYGGQPHFSRASLTQWKKSNGYYDLTNLGLAQNDHFAPTGSTREQMYDAFYLKLLNPAKTEWLSGSEGDTLLERNQNFPLQVMQDTTYIDPATRDAQKNIGQSLTPNQVTFFETTTLKTAGELITKFGQIPSTARKEPYNDAWKQYWNLFEHDIDYSMIDGRKPKKKKKKKENAPDELYQLKIGSSWLVSGQNISSSPISLPLEKTPMESSIDRQQFPYIWEVGRAAQTEQGGFTETLSSSCYFILRELLLLGGSIDKAFVFAHSLKPLHTRLYRSTFGMQLFSKYKNENDGVALWAPLQKMVDLFPPTEFLANIREIYEASKDKAGNPKLSHFEAFELDFQMRQNRSLFLESKKGSVVTLRDFSPLSLLLMQQSHSKIFDSLTDHTHQQTLLALEKITTHRSRADTLDKDISKESFGSSSQDLSIRQFLYTKKAIELQIEAKNGDSIEQLAQSAIYFLLHKIYSYGITNPIEFMQKNEIQIAITTRSQMDLATTTDQWHELDRWEAQSFDTHTWDPMMFGTGGFTLHKKGIFIASSIYSVADIFNSSKDSDYNKKPDLKTGNSHLQHHLYSPELYSGD